MTGPLPERKGRRTAGRVFAGAVTALAFASPVAGASPAAPFSPSISVETRLVSLLFDSDYPGHPRATALGHAGIVGDLATVWSLTPALTVRAGATVRLPFALQLTPEAQAFPLVALELRPAGDLLLLRFGSLDRDHGFHPALTDEARYVYGRNYETLYHQSVPDAARRPIGDDPFLPVENGAQARLAWGDLSAELFVDWQLLETRTHREKFAVGFLASYTLGRIEAGVQGRLVHYGGQRFTLEDPIRAAGLDPKRQPMTGAVLLTGTLVRTKTLSVTIPLALLGGRAVQSPGAETLTHRGLELGADLKYLDFLRLGYRLWLPKAGRDRYLGEDGDPVYAGRRSQRAILETGLELEAVRLSGRLDLIFARGESRVQYRTTTLLTLRWEELLFVW